MNHPLGTLHDDLVAVRCKMLEHIGEKSTETHLWAVTEALLQFVVNHNIYGAHAPETKPE